MAIFDFFMNLFQSQKSYIYQKIVISMKNCLIGSIGHVSPIKNYFFFHAGYYPVWLRANRTKDFNFGQRNFISPQEAIKHQLWAPKKDGNLWKITGPASVKNTFRVQRKVLFLVTQATWVPLILCLSTDFTTFRKVVLI